MYFRPHSRDIVLGVVLAVSLLGLVAGTRAEGSLWARPAESRDGAARLLPAGMERTVLRAQRSDHVREQIEKMEARARADERLSGRNAKTGVRTAEAPPDATRPTQETAQSSDGRPANIGPGWQAPGRDASR